MIAAHVRTLRRIDRHLAEHPAVFADGPTHAHHSVGRFVEALIDAGVDLAVSYVDCEDCGRNLLTMRNAGRMTCASCANKARATECGRCGDVALVATRDDNGGAVCPRCLDAERQLEIRQALTSQIVEAVDDLGIDDAEVIAAVDATASTNGQRARVLAALEHEPALQESCRRRPSTIRFTDELRSRGADIPAADRPKPRPGTVHRCPNCDRRTNQANTTNCRACVAEAIAARTSDCTRCGRRVQDVTDGLCGLCHYRASRVCNSCDARFDLVEVRGIRRCHRCLLAAELDTLAGTRPAGWVTDICDALRSAKCAAETRRWLAQTSGGRLLGRLAAGDVETSHAELDRRSDRSIERLRGLLIVTGGLAPDNQGLARLENAVTALTAGIDNASDRRVVQSYLRWQALPTIRRRSERGASIIHSGGNLRQRTSVICRFVTTLNVEGRTLQDCRQVDIDNWFGAPGALPAVATSFMTWARKHHHFPAGLEIPASKKAKQPTTPIDHQLRWAHARRLVNDDTLNADDRVAGALVVLYAQPLTRIAALTVDDVVVNDSGEVSIEFRTHQIDLTEPFAALARQLPIRRKAGAADLLHTRWLFPATRPDQAVNPTTIASRLGRIGIDPRPTRLAAISQLASEIPPALLAESIGIGARQASKWVGVSGGNWTNYTGH